jgi:hypothetical protein
LSRKHLPILALGLLLLVGMAAADKSPPPIFGVTIPDGYRQWEVIAPSQDEKTGDIRAILGNSVAMKAYRPATLPFPDGSVIAKLSWERSSQGTSRRSSSWSRTRRSTRPLKGEDSAD